MQAMSRTIVLAAILAVGAPALAQTPAPPVVSQTAPEAQTSEASQVVCKMVPVTGSRVKKQKVCNDPASQQGSERDRDNLRRFQNGSGNTQPVLPGGVAG